MNRYAEEQFSPNTLFGNEFTVNREKTSSDLPGNPKYTSRGVTVRSPLRYPGGKSRAVLQLINQYIPRKIQELCSPFVGGGSVELALAQRGVKIYAYDFFEPLVIFWQMLLKDRTALSRQVRKYADMTPELFYSLQKTFTKLDDKLEIAAIFYALNRSSFSGTTLSGGMSPGHPRFNAGSVERLENFKTDNFSVELSDFTKSIPKHRNVFLYCDPPYLIPQKLYGNRGDRHKDFDHETLAEILTEREQWLLSYNDCEEIRELYRGHYMITPQWVYGMGNSKKSNELLIMSKDYKNLI